MTTCLGKSCSFGLPRVPFVNCCQFMYLVISLLVLRTRMWNLIYRFLIIAYFFYIAVRKGSQISKRFGVEYPYTSVSSSTECLKGLGGQEYERKVGSTEQQPGVKMDTHSYCLNQVKNINRRNAYVSKE